MESITLIAIPLFCLIGFLHVWRIESRRTIIFTPFLLLMINEFVRVMPAFIYAVIIDISDIYPLFVFFVGYIMLIIGFLCSIRYFHYKSVIPKLFFYKIIKYTSERKIIYSIIFTTIVLILMGLYLYKGLPYTVDLIFSVFKGEVSHTFISDIGETRKEITKSHIFGGKDRGQGLIRVLMKIWWPIIVGLTLTTFWQIKSGKWLLASVILLILSFIFIAGDGTRGNFINTLIIYFIIYSYMHKLSFRFVITSWLIICIVGILMSMYSPKMDLILDQENFILNAMNQILNRIFIGNAINDIYAIEFVRNSIIDYKFGAIHFRDLVASIPGIPSGPPFAHELYTLLNPGGRQTTYATGTYLSKVYIDFGIMGVGIIYFLIGITIGIIQKNIFYFNKTNLSIVLIAILSLYFGNIVLIGPVGTGVSILSTFILYIPLKMFLKTKPGNFDTNRYHDGYVHK